MWNTKNQTTQFEKKCNLSIIFFILKDFLWITLRNCTVFLFLCFLSFASKSYLAFRSKNAQVQKTIRLDEVKNKKRKHVIVSCFYIYIVRCIFVYVIIHFFTIARDHEPQGVCWKGYITVPREASRQDRTQNESNMKTKIIQIHNIQWVVFTQASKFIFYKVVILFFVTRNVWPSVWFVIIKGLRKKRRSKCAVRKNNSPVTLEAWTR